MKYVTIITATLALFMSWGCDSVDASPPPPPKPTMQTFTKGESMHEPFNTYLQKYVADGVVNYKGMKADIKILDTYISAISVVDPAKMKMQNEKMAFWINAYNAFTLKLILMHYPGIASIKDISSSSRWKWKGWYVNSTLYSLDQIEHEILRKMGDPRIHFTIVCASISCPDLASEAYEAKTLDAQLTTAAKKFLANKQKGLTFKTSSGIFGTSYTVTVSKIFSWFSEDFVNKSGSVEAFLELYAPEDAVAYLRAHKDDISLGYLDYDWNLNGK